MSDIPECDSELWENGITLGIYDPYPFGMAEGFEKLIVQVRETTGLPIDWHYVGGRACVRAYEKDAALLRPVLNEVLKSPQQVSTSIWTGDGLIEILPVK